MKRYILSLMMTCGIFIIGNTQSQELNTSYTILIGPENVDSYYEDQFSYYQTYFKELKADINESIEEEEESRKKINGLNKLKGKDKRRLKKIEEKLILLQADLKIIEEFSNYWKEFEENEFQKIKNFEKEFKSDNCYTIKRGKTKLKPKEYDIEFINFGEEISWNEFMVGKELDLDRQHVFKDGTPNGTIYVKKRADKECKSSDPNDCMVWCLMFVRPWEVSFIKDDEFYRCNKIDECPNGFDFSIDDTFCSKNIIVTKTTKNDGKLALKYKSYPFAEIRLSDYSISKCED